MKVFLVVFIVSTALVSSSWALSLSSSLEQDAAKVSRSLLREALSSPSGKLTVTPEVIVNEPTDPTALLLQSHSIQVLSEKLRACKANAALIQTTSMTSLQTFISEQESARGSFPGPVPVIYKPPLQSTTTTTSMLESVDFNELAKTGVQGIMVPVVLNDEASSSKNVLDDAASGWQESCCAALDVGLQPIPEIIIPDGSVDSWTEETIEKLVDQISEKIGSEPVSVVFSTSVEEEDTDESDATTTEDDGSTINDLLPTIPKALGKRLSFLGSVRVPAGENRLGGETSRYKSSGFTGTVLRHECMPGSIAMSQDLEFVGRFWSACIGDLKSTKSKAFSFNSKNNMEKTAATQWSNYQQSVVNDGALGDPNEALSAMVDHANGDYQGF